jgi:hypothetical protein
MQVSDPRIRRLRLEKRKRIQMPVGIDAGNGLPLIHGIMWDISIGGAKLIVAAGANVPRHFVLHLGGSNNARRECEVMWSCNRKIGIRFMSEPVFNEGAAARVRQAM